MIFAPYEVRDRAQIRNLDFHTFRSELRGALMERKKVVFGKSAIGAILGAILGYGLNVSGLNVDWIPSGFSKLGGETDVLIACTIAGAFVGLCFWVIDR